MGTWLNADGLYIKYGTDEATVATAGWFPYPDEGENQVAEVTITLTSLGTAAAIQNDTVTIPNGARIEYVELVTVTAATSGGAAVLNVGLIDQNRTTAFDADGLIAASAITTHDAAGETTILRVGSTGAGALIGTTLTNTGLIVADYDTAAYTAGVVKVRVHYNMIS